MKKIFLILIIIFSISACSKEESKKGIILQDAWIRPAAKGMNSGLFLKIVNNTGINDTLIAAKANFAHIVQIHESFETEDGRKGMKHLKALPVNRGETLTLEPGKYHIMLIRLLQDVKVGEKFKVKLIFSQFGEVETNCRVK